MHARIVWHGHCNITMIIAEGRFIWVNCHATCGDSTGITLLGFPSHCRRKSWRSMCLTSAPVYTCCSLNTVVFSALKMRNINNLRVLQFCGKCGLKNYWSCGKFSHIFSSVNFNSQTVLALNEAFIERLHRSPGMISPVQPDLER